MCSFFSKTDVYNHRVSEDAGKSMAYAFTEEDEVFEAFVVSQTLIGLLKPM